MTVYNRNMQRNLILITVIGMKTEAFVIFVYIYGLHSSHILLPLLKALQLQRSFGLLNEFFPFGPVSDAALPIRYFHSCYIPFYIILPSVFRSS